MSIIPSPASMKRICTLAALRCVPWRRLMSQATSGHARVAIVTGAASGIGRAVALRLADDGYNLALNDLHSTESALDQVRAAIANKGRQVFVSTGDVSKEEDVKKLVTGAADELGSVDVMVANAGICIVKPLIETTVEDWDKIFSINSRGVFLCYKHAAQQMIKQGKGGRIIGASSAAGMRGFTFVGGYSATKFSVRGLTQVAAQEWAKYGINVNAYAPGPTQTGMSEVSKDVPEDSRATAIVRGVQGVRGTPDDIAGLVSYLALEESRFITGQTMLICGGMVFS